MLAKDKPVAHGGQAVIEGVMMKGRTVMATAVRKASGEIVVDKTPVVPWSSLYRFLGWPLFRGAIALVESLVIGSRALTFSASQFAEGEDVELSNKDLAGMMALALLFTVVVFIALPAFLIRLVQSHIANTILLNLLEGLIKVGLFSLYIIGISRLADIRRVFEYHGAEHKTINAYEAGVELTPANVQKFSTLHYRCGTNFIVVVLLVSVFIFSFFGRPPHYWQRVLIHLAILPLVAGVAFEVIRYASQKNSFFLVRWIAAPGLLFQRLTTRKPDDSQVEVAIRALNEVLAGLPDRSESPDSPDAAGTPGDGRPPLA